MVSTGTLCSPYFMNFDALDERMMWKRERERERERGLVIKEFIITNFYCNNVVTGNCILWWPPWIPFMVWLLGGLGRIRCAGNQIRKMASRFVLSTIFWVPLQASIFPFENHLEIKGPVESSLFCMDCCFG